MRARTTAWLIGGLLALSVAAQAADAAGDKKDGHGTVKKEDVKTWTMTVDGEEWSARLATPSYDGDTGLFRLSTAYTLPKGKAAVSFFRDNYDRDPKKLDFSVHGLNIAYGAATKLEIFGKIELQDRLKTGATRQAGFFNDLPFAGTTATSPGWQTGVGDVKLGVKYGILNDYMDDSVGLAIKGYVKLPTADEEKGLGSGKASFGADLVLSKQLGYNADIHASIGYLVNSDPDDVAIGNAFKWGVGLEAPACRKFGVQAEVTGWVYSGADFDQTSPLDFVIGPVVWLKPGIFIRPAWSYALGYDARGDGGSLAKKSGRQISIGYHPGTPCCEVVAPPPPPPPPANRPPTVALDCVKDSILAGETTPCNATASDPDGDPLTYSWSASAGRVSGTGAGASFDSTGVPCGTGVTVTVRVSDGRGGTASATDTVKVVCPEKKPEPITCNSGGFPRNLARLNNVDKACLDDVAARLKQDPRSRVVIVGHADKLERYPEVIGRKRAEAVKSYLVKERGVEESRISVKSAAASRPLDTGATAIARAKNRRVEVIFVPEGAVLPEDDD